MGYPEGTNSEAKIMPTGGTGPERAIAGFMQRELAGDPTVAADKAEYSRIGLEVGVGMLVGEGVGAIASRFVGPVIARFLGLGEKAISPAATAAAQLESAATNLGVNLSKITINNGVAKVNIVTAENISFSNIKIIRDFLTSKGATNVEVNTGYVLNPKLATFLEGRVQSGVKFMGGSVTRGVELGSDFIIHF